MKIKFKETKLINQSNFQTTLIKAVNNINSYELSEYRFEQDYQLAFIKYMEEIVDSMVTGLALKLDVNPLEIRKSYRFSQLTLLKASQGKLSEESFLLKSIWQDLKDKYTKAISNFQKFFSKFKPLQPMKLSGRLVYNPETKKDLTFDEYRNIETGVMDYLKDSIGDPDEELVVRAGLFALLKKKMEDDNISIEKQKQMSYDNIYDRYGDFVNDTTKAKKELLKEKQMGKAIEYAKKHAAEYLSIEDGELKNKIVKMFKKQIVGGLEDGLTKQEMLSRLYWIDPSDVLGKRFNEETVNAWNRDMRRICITEYSFATNEGYLAAVKDDAKKGEKLYFVYSGRYNPQEKPNEPCNSFLGKVCLLVDEPQASDDSTDPLADFLIWSGKTNVGRRHNEWWICCPTHPHCTHHWSKINPEFQEWDPTTESIELKEFGKSFNDEELDLIKNDPVKKIINFEGYKIAVEWKKGETRQYPGSPYKNLMHYDYGYLKNTDSPDGEEIDICLNKPIKQKKTIYMLFQKLDNKFDELKFGIGFSTSTEFKNAYIKTMTKGMFGGIVSLSLKKFKDEMKFYFRKKELSKSKESYIDNIEWNKDKAKEIKQNISLMIKKVKNYLNIETPIIVRLYKEHSKGKEIRSMHDEGIIIIYQSSPDYIFDFLHELGHFYYHYINLDDNKEVLNKLSEIKKQIENSKEYNRIFDNEHTFSNVKEIFANLFKWCISGKFTDIAYSEVLKQYCPLGYNLFNDLNDLLQKAFIKPPLNKEGRIDFPKVPMGASIWITKNGLHIPITRFTGDKFAVDFQAARNAGYEFRKKESSISHLVFKINKKEKIEPIEEKERRLTKKEKEKKEKREATKKIKVELRQLQKDSKKQIIRALTDKAKDIQLNEKLKNEIKEKIKDYNLTDEQKEIYTQAVIEESNKLRRRNKLNNAIRLTKNRSLGADKQSLNLINPTNIQDKYDLINKVKDGLYEKGDSKVSIKYTADKKNIKNMDQEKLKQLVDVYKTSIQKRSAFEKLMKNIMKKKTEEILKIKIEDIKVTEKDIAKSEKLFKATKNNNAGKSLYTVLSKYWKDGGHPQIEYLANKAAMRQLNSLLAKNISTHVDMKRMVESIGIERSARLLAVHLKRTLDKKQYNKLKESVETYFLEEAENIENNTLEKIQKLKNDVKNIKTKTTMGKVYDKEAEYSLVKNLIQQRNILGSAYGMLKSTSEFLNALKKAKYNEKIEVDLPNNRKQAYEEYKSFTFYKDRKNTKLKMLATKNKMVINPESMNEFYLKESKIHKEKNKTLNEIKHNTKGILVDKNGNQYVKYMPPGFKDKFPDGTPIRLRPSQRNDIQFLLANGGRGITARSVGAGKTMVAVGFHAERLKGNPSYSTVMVLPDKGVKQQYNEIKKFTNLDVVQINEDFSPDKKEKLLKRTSAVGKIIVMSHTDIAKYSHMLKRKNINNLVIDEPHEIFFDKNGDIKSKGKEIIGNIKTEDRIALTASPVQENPSDIYNLINWVDPHGVGKRGNFRSQFGDRENYKLNGMTARDNYSFTDMSLGKSNLMREYFRDIIDSYVTNDNLIKRGYRVDYKNPQLKIPPEMNKKLLKHLNTSKAGLNKFLEETPRYIKEQYPASWKERRKQKFVDKIVADQIKLANRIEGNPKTKEFIKNLNTKLDEKHVVYVDDSEHLTSVVESLKKNNYPENQIYSMLGGRKSSVENKTNWIESENPGILFITRKQVAGHNLQAANTLHKLGTMFTGIEDIQVDGRVPRGNRTEDVDIINYSYNTMYENNLKNKVKEYKDKLSSIDTSLLVY